MFNNLILTLSVLITIMITLIVFKVCFKVQKRKKDKITITVKQESSVASVSTLQISKEPM